jgi:hypothetical protein
VQNGYIILCILCPNRVDLKVELIFLLDKYEVSEQFWKVCSKDSSYLYATRRSHVVITIVISRMLKWYGKGGRGN